MRFCYLVALVSLFAPVSAQSPGTCSPGQASSVLSEGSVRAKLYNTGSLFYKEGVVSSQYVVPKSTSNTALFAASLWVGGTVDGSERVAGSTFQATEFWPGPLLDGAVLPDPTDCSPYDRIYHIKEDDVDRYERFGTASDNLAEWPIGLGAPAVDAGGELVRPSSRSQTIDLAAGERPVLFGTEMAFWVMNDVGSSHESSGSAPLGVEVQAIAFVVDSSDLRVEQQTFYRFRVVNRNSQPIEDLRITWWQDTDLGGGGDEYQGTDPSRSLAFTYNDAEDQVYAIPPATGVDFLSGAFGASLALVNGDARRGDPGRDPVHFRNIQRGRWRDSTAITRRLTGYNSSSGGSDDDGGEPPLVDPDTTLFSFEGDPTTGAFWSELNADGEGTALGAGNKRSVSSTSGVTLQPGQAVDLDMALLFAQGASNLNSVTRLFEISDLIQARYTNGSLFPIDPLITDTKADPVSGVQIQVVPNPSRDQAAITVRLDRPGAVRIDVVDALGRRVARLADATWGAGERSVRVEGLAPGVYLAIVAMDGARHAIPFTVIR